ncbi:pectinesterase family protein [Nonomuraea insulae]|uniref:Pectinesterase family protein n=1 Tax=Nonomuraea insulae TaxID=1616787 RepID=A0ABW1CIH6_9ACTN
MREKGRLPPATTPSSKRPAPTSPACSGPSTTSPGPAPTGTPTVAADGTGRYRTVQAAIDAVSSSNTGRVVITSKPGDYRETVTLNKPYVTLQGLGSSPSQTVIVNNRSAYTSGPITAASTPATKTYGYLFYKSRITGATNNTTQLGRPWRQDAQVLYRESTLSATIKTAQPWTDMSTNTWQNARFLEYRNNGAGATTNSNRPQLPGRRLNPAEVSGGQRRLKPGRLTTTQEPAAPKTEKPQLSSFFAALEMPPRVHGCRWPSSNYRATGGRLPGPDHSVRPRRSPVPQGGLGRLGEVPGARSSPI